MMRKRKNILEKMTSSVDLPLEPLPGVPLVEIAGENRVLIENHKGVIQYGNERICIKVLYGQVVVEGVCLKLCRMSKEQLVVKGGIDAIRIFRG